MQLTCLPVLEQLGGSAASRVQGWLDTGASFRVLGFLVCYKRCRLSCLLLRLELDSQPRESISGWGLTVLDLACMWRLLHKPQGNL